MLGRLHGNRERPGVYHAAGLGAVVGPAEASRRLPGLDRATWEAADRLFPVRVPRAWFDAVDPSDPRDPMALQALPSPRELAPDPGDRADPVGDAARSPVPWVVRKHPDRVLLLLTTRCHMHCRYCFRRAHRPGAGPDPSPSELEAALAFCEGSGAREAILSGGDPLAVPDRRLFAVIDRLRASIPVLRLHTRSPVSFPSRVDGPLVERLARRSPLWIVVHVNHPRELGPPARGALARLVDAGIPVLSQSVLLAGVNDDAGVLERLLTELVALRVFPYYLHHPDPAPGNAGFRVSPRRGVDLVRELAGRVSGVALPRYVVDLPDGSGKIDVERALAEGLLEPED